MIPGCLSDDSLFFTKSESLVTNTLFSSNESLKTWPFVMHLGHSLVSNPKSFKKKNILYAHSHLLKISY